jgi:hypothetical protein
VCRCVARSHVVFCLAATQPQCATAFIPPGAELWPFDQWALQPHHRGPVLGLHCPRASSEITVEVILCKYSRQGASQHNCNLRATCVQQHVLLAPAKLSHRHACDNEAAHHTHPCVRAHQRRDLHRSDASHQRRHAHRRIDRHTLTPTRTHTDRPHITQRFWRTCSLQRVVSCVARFCARTLLQCVGPKPP